MTNNQNVVRQPENPTLCAAYIRTSTVKQTGDLQRQALTKYGKRKGLKIEWFEDQGSGANPTRPHLEAMMKRIRQGEFEMVLVWKFDRFARSTLHMAQALAEFESLGVGFFSYSEGFDTSTPFGKAMFSMAAAFGQLELDIITERNRAMQAAARARGKHIGRPQAYTLKDGDIFKGRDRLGPIGDDSTRAAAKRLGIPRSTIQRLRA